MKLSYQNVVVKIGSNVLTQSDGLPDLKRMKHLVGELTVLKKAGVNVILVSSGAVAFGRSLIGISEKKDVVAARQLLASVGQVKLINTYAQLFAEQEITCAQVLVTKEDFRDRVHYLNIKNCLQILLGNNVIPIVNENDVVSVTELMFTDNDELAGLISAMWNADALVILSNVAGIYTGHPEHPESVLLEKISGDQLGKIDFIASAKSQFGRGGMVTKSAMAQKTATLGIPVHIANGMTPNVLKRLFDGELAHTQFMPRKGASNIKKWIASSESVVTGEVEINIGAKEAITADKAASLLLVGVVRIISPFKKGDIIRLVDPLGHKVGYGLAEYPSEKAIELLGQKKIKPLVHYDYFYQTS